MLLDPEVDGKNYKHINNPKARLEVLKIITELNLYDIYRCENSESRLFTWKKKLNQETYKWVVGFLFNIRISY